MTDVALTHIQYWCRPRSHALISPILVTFEQSGHTQGSVCCLRSSVTRWNHYESHMLLLVFLTGAPPAHTHTHTLLWNLQTKVNQSFFIFMSKKKKRKKPTVSNCPRFCGLYFWKSWGENKKRDEYYGRSTAKLAAPVRLLVSVKETITLLDEWKQRHTFYP